MTDRVQDLTIQQFLDQLASATPTPGGGSAAALNGAIAAGLISMVCAVTMSKKKQDEQSDVARTIHEQSEEVRLTLQTLAQADIAVFAKLAAAYKLPRTTDADAASRRAAIQKITREAADIPLQVARHTAALLPLCTAIVNRCSRMIVSDIGVAAFMIRATVQSALLNVEINLATLEDIAYVQETRAHMEDLSVGLAEETVGIVEIVQHRIANERQK